MSVGSRSFGVWRTYMRRVESTLIFVQLSFSRVPGKIRCSQPATSLTGAPMRHCDRWAPIQSRRYPNLHRAFTLRSPGGQPALTDSGFGAAPASKADPAVLDPVIRSGGCMRGIRRWRVAVLAAAGTACTLGGTLALASTGGQSD